MANGLCEKGSEFYNELGLEGRRSSPSTVFGDERIVVLNLSSN